MDKGKPKNGNFFGEETSAVYVMGKLQMMTTIKMIILLNNK